MVIKIFPQKRVELFWKFYKYLFPYRKKEALLIILSLLIAGLGLVSPYIGKLVIDQAFGRRDLNLFLVLIAVSGALFIVSTLFNLANDYLANALNFKLTFDLRRKVIGHLSRLSLRFFQSKPLGGYLYRADSDVNLAAGFITGILPDAIRIFPRLVFTLVIIFHLNRNMFWMAIALSPFLYISPYFFNKKRVTIAKELSQARESLMSKFIAFFSRIQLVKAFGREAQEFRNYLRHAVDNLRLEAKSLRLGAASDLSSGTINKIAVGLVTFYGGFMVIKGEMTLGSLTAIMMYLNQMIGLQGSVVGFFQQFNFGLIPCERLNEILEEEPVKRSGRCRVISEGEIEFRNCTFGYEEDILVLERMSFHIEASNAVAFVGPSGCGKTTIVNLLLKLYEPSDGEILVDNEDIKSWDTASLREQIGVALQETFLWNDTVENNIRFGKPDATKEEVVRSAEITGVDIFLQSLPEGYQIKFGEGGGRFSQGQKQRIALSRAIIKKPKILILDEAMSSLDIESEKQILHSLLKERKGLTTIIISHRPAALELADKIYLIESRDKITCGTLPQLRQTNKMLLNLFTELPRP